MKPIRIAGTGSAIADYLYDGIDFGGNAFRRFRSMRPGDGGLEPGKLVLTEDFEAFSGVNVDDAVRQITGDREPDSFNLGGPAAAALINCAQMLAGVDATVRFYAVNGADEAGARLRGILEKTPLDESHFRDFPGSSPYTVVLSDPAFNGGAGERTFINNIGSSWRMKPEFLDDEFYGADIRLFGGTALVPPIHEALTEALQKGAERGGLNVVTTVYDFPNEKKSPHRHWPLGSSDESYRFMDLLICDREEAFRLSGTDSIESVKNELFRRGLSALIVTGGTDDVALFAESERFEKETSMVPISRSNVTERGDSPWDTTGCGDNFAGAVLASLAGQIADGRRKCSLSEACCWGVAAGDFACYYMGGTYLEKNPGEKLKMIRAIFDRYMAEHIAERDVADHKETDRA